MVTKDYQQKARTNVWLNVVHILMPKVVNGQDIYVVYTHKPSVEELEIRILIILVGYSQSVKSEISRKQVLKFVLDVYLKGELVKHITYDVTIQAIISNCT